MFETISGIIFLTLGILGLIYTIKCKRQDRLFVLYKISKKKYEVINKEKFDFNILIQNYIVSIYAILLGLIAILTKNLMVIQFGLFIPLIRYVFNINARKYIKII